MSDAAEVLRELWTVAAQGWASAALTIEAWLAAMPLSRDAQLLIAIDIVLLAIAVVLLRRHRRPAGDMAASTAPPRGGTARAIAHEPPDSIRGYMAAGLAVVALLVGGVGGWASTSELSGAVIAQGTVVVDTNVKKVQHPSGGIIGEIRVREGDVVKSGDLLLRLDETQTRANLQIFTSLLAGIGIRQMRLIAERDDWTTQRLTDALEERLRRATQYEQPAAMRESVDGELHFFASRAKAREGQKAQLKERMAQLTEEIAGLTAQRTAKNQEIVLVRRELANVETLEAKQLVTINRMTLLRRDEARIDGELGQLQAAVAQARGKIAEIELQVIQIDNELRSEVSKELREIQNREAELNERRVAAEDQLSRIAIRAPQSGIVHQLAVHTVGGVINAGELLMLIVPEGDRLVVDARLAPQDIDQVRVDQTAYIRFPAFNQRTTPEISARVERIAADLTRETQGNVSYFMARLEVRAEELSRFGQLQLVPGMPAEVHIKTGDRTALSYLVKPLQDQLSRAFRER